jgi:uncharacterized protein YyaL (SSP411 family)
MISSLVSAFTATEIKEYLKTAEKSANFMMDNLYSKTDGIYHYYFKGKKQLKGILTDNVLFATALLDLYNVTGTEKYMDTAHEIGNFIINDFYDKDIQQFRPSLDTTLIKPVRAGMLQDFQTALVNFRTTILMSRLYYIDKNKIIHSIVDNVLSAYKKSYTEFLTAAPLYATALRWHLKEPVEIHIVAGHSKAKRFITEINRIYLPEKVVYILSPKKNLEAINRLGYPPDREAAYVCQGKRCSRPLSNPKELAGLIKEFIKF